MRMSMLLRSASAASLLGLFVFSTPALAADGVWRKADEMPSAAVTACEAKIKAEGFMVAQILAGRSIDHYVDLRYRLLKGGKDSVAVCRYASGLQKALLTASKVARQQ